MVSFIWLEGWLTLILAVWTVSGVLEVLQKFVGWIKPWIFKGDECDSSTTHLLLIFASFYFE